MACNVQRYFDQKAELARRPLLASSTGDLDTVVVIPAFAERDHLFQTLDSLALNPPEQLRHTLVICVVNNRAEPHASPEHIANNQDTLHVLKPLVGAGALRLACVDASSPGLELPDKGGVGLARKIGLDHGLAVLAGQSDRGALVCLDADTRVEPNYLATLRSHFARRNAWAAVVDYAHDDAPTPDDTAAIVCYELFLRYHVLALSWAGSPYAFPTIGSTMACTPEAYVAVAGMNQRQAGEDFYFLQQLAKTGPVRQLFGTTVHPSSRPSSRVPFGTGQRVRRYLAGEHEEYRLYDPRSYAVLKQWLQTVAGSLDASAQDLLAEAGRICPELGSFVQYAGFEAIWPGLQRNAPSPQKLLGQFHRWFDGFKTIKLLHHLRDTSFPDVEMFGAIGETLRRLNVAMDTPFEGLQRDVCRQKVLLEQLRSLERAKAE